MVLEKLEECVSGVESTESKAEQRKPRHHRGWYEWSVNDYGVYYSCGCTFGVVPHETGKRKILCRSGRFTSSFVRHTLRPDGTDSLLTISANHYYNTGTAEYLMDVQYTGTGYKVWCLDTMTNETWELTVGEGPTIYSIETDCHMAYACVP